MAAVAHTFGMGPHAAHIELGGRPMIPRKRRRLTLTVLEAAHGERLHAEFKATEGAKTASENLVQRWTEADHAFYRELMQADGDGG